MDAKKRDDIYRKILDRITDQHYVLPLTTFPTIFIHTKDLVIKRGSLTTAGAQLSEMHWK
jgi:hypothetical protein